MTQTKETVRWKRGAYDVESRPDADIAHAEILRIRSKHGEATPEKVVEEAKADDNPLHQCFTWDDDAAAHQFRLRQAREVMNSIEVVILDEEPDGNVRERASAPAFVNITTEENRSYVPINVVLDDAGMRKQMLDRALAELEAWQRRYAHLHEFSIVWDAIKRYQNAS